MTNVIPFRPRKQPSSGSSGFDEIAHPRAGDGKFAPKTRGEAKVELSVVKGRTHDQRVEDAVAAMADHPEGLDQGHARDYDNLVPSAINPGLTERETISYTEMMRGSDPQTTHQMYGTISDLRSRDSDPVDQIPQMREQVSTTLDYLAAEHPDTDPRREAAIAAICHHLDDDERDERWDRFEAASRAAHAYHREPTVSLEGQRDRRNRDDQLGELMKDHPLWKRI